MRIKTGMLGAWTTSDFILTLYRVRVATFIKPRGHRHETLIVIHCVFRLLAKYSERNVINCNSQQQSGEAAEEAEYCHRAEGRK